MAQIGFTPISLYNSTTAAQAPTAGNLVNGELAINITDGKLYYKDNAGVVQTIATKAGASGDVVGPASATDNAIARYDGTTGKLIQNSGVTIDDSNNVANIVNLAYTGTLTGGTGVINIGSGQIYKDASGNVGIGTATPAAGVRLDTFGGYMRLRSNTTINSDISGNVNALVFESSGGTGEHAIIAGGNTSNNVLTFYTANSTTPAERMRIDSSGNVGIGTSSPALRLSVSGSLSATTQVVAGATTAYADGSIGTPSLQWNLTSGVRVGAISIADSTAYQSHYVLRNPNGNVASIGTDGTSLTFATSGLTERMRIDSSGNVGIGVTPVAKFDIISGSARLLMSNQSATAFVTAVNTTNSAYAPLAINGSEVILKTGDAERARIDSSGLVRIANTNTSLWVGTEKLAVEGFSLFKNAGTPALVWNTDASGGLISFSVANRTDVGSITSNGTTTAYNTTSDYRLKENVAPMTGALAKVAALKPCTYTWKSTGEAAQGFIAHELQEVVPDCVTGEKDGMRTEQYEISPAIPAVLGEDGEVIEAAVEAVMGEREVPSYQGVDTSFLVATLVAAIQELKADFDAYKAAHP